MNEKKKYPTKAEKSETILNAAYELACESGFANLRRADIASRADVATGSVNYCFDTLDALRDAVVTKAIEEEQLKILGHALASGNIIAQNAPIELRKKAMISLV